MILDLSREVLDAIYAFYFHWWYIASGKRLWNLRRTTPTLIAATST